MNEPSGLVKAAEQPEVLPGLCHDAEVVAADGVVTPPTSLDPLWSPTTDDSVIATVPTKVHRRALWPSRRGLDPLRRREETKRAGLG